MALMSRAYSELTQMSSFCSVTSSAPTPKAAASGPEDSAEESVGKTGRVPHWSLETKDFAPVAW